MQQDPPSGFDLLHKTDTLHLLSEQGMPLKNLPQQPETWEAIRQMEARLLTQLLARFGPFHISYGFASPVLVAAVRKRAKEEGRNPQIAPDLDQHCGHELNRRGQRICKRDGIAVDLKVPGVSSEVAAQWIRENLPFDRMYLYGDERPLHLSWAAQPVGQVWRMVEVGGGRRVPRT